MHKTNYNIFFCSSVTKRSIEKLLLSKNAVKKNFLRQLIAALNSGNKAGAFFLQVDSS